MSLPRAVTWSLPAMICLGFLSTFTVNTSAAEPNRRWTIYLAQDKHLDYNWCGSTTQIELRMAAFVDYYLDHTQRKKGRWNLDGTIWSEVYRRHRGEAGAARLHDAIRGGRFGYGGNYAVLLWGILDTETAIRACYGALPIEQSTGMRARTALIMENPGLTWGAANVLSQCGFDFLARGIYWLRAESYNGHRQPYPLFWWKAASGKNILVHWDLYHDTKSWGGYAEAHCLAAMAGEKWNAFGLQSFGDRNRPDVFRKRKQFIRQTIEHYEAYGENYPISSILLLGTGWDNWTQTGDYSEFIKRFNAESDETVRLVDARYQDFFEAVEKEIREKNLTIPILEGSFGICWEEWAAHLAGPTAEFREAQRLLRLAEAVEAVDRMSGGGDAQRQELVRHGVTQLLKFAEHDFGGTDRRRAAMSAGARASAVTQAMDIGRSLAPRTPTIARAAADEMETKPTAFAWRGGRVVFDPARCAVTSVEDADGYPWVPTGRGRALGELVHTRYKSRAQPDSVFPEALVTPSDPAVRRLRCRTSDRGVDIVVEFDHSGFRVLSTWLFHTESPWIDVTFHLRDGWNDEPQSVEFCFPLNVDRPTYRYDAPGAILVAGSKEGGGDDLPGANPELFAGVTFAAASGDARTALLVAPDTLLLRFGQATGPGAATDLRGTAAQISSMPMMNLTGNDWQFGQGGQRQWTFRYRIVLLKADFDPVRAVTEANRFATPPFLQVPGQPPRVPGLEALNVDFAGGPLLAFKTAQDNRRLILRFWNVQGQSVAGSFRMPRGWTRAFSCDALERPQDSLKTAEGRVQFQVGPRGIATVAIGRET